MNEHRDRLSGRFTGRPDWERPLPETWPKPKSRALMPAHKRKHPDLMTLRMPPVWREKLDFIAERDQKTVREVILEAIANYIAPVISEQKGLRDEVRSMPSDLGQNRKMGRLEQEVPSPVKQEVPAYDHVGRWKARQKREFGGKLSDAPKR